MNLVTFTKKKFVMQLLQSHDKGGKVLTEPEDMKSRPLKTKKVHFHLMYLKIGMEKPDEQWK